MPDTTFLIALLAAILSAASVILHIVAPRTKATWDDAARDDIDEVLTWWRGRPAVAPVAAAPTGKPPGGTGTAGVLAVLLLGLAGAGSMASCTAAQTRQVAAAGAVAALDCEIAHATPDVQADLKAFAEAKAQGWISGTAPPGLVALQAKVKADLALFQSDAGRCAIAGVLAAVAAIATPPEPGTATSALVAAGPDPATVRVAFGAAARELGWPPVRLPGGEVL